MFRIECPSCQTSYTNSRCGLKVPEPDETIDIVVQCLCGTEIRAFVEWVPGYTVAPPAWQFWRSATQTDPTLLVTVQR